MNIANINYYRFRFISDYCKYKLLQIPCNSRLDKLELPETLDSRLAATILISKRPG